MKVLGLASVNDAFEGLKQQGIGAIQPGAESAQSRLRRQIIEWHKSNPQIALHCFYDKPDAPPEFRHDNTLTFHRLDGEKFLRMMAECKYVACTAGFESLSEAAWLGKPMFLVPVENHVEQQINAIDATRLGLGVTETSAICGLLLCHSMICRRNRD